MRSLIALMLLLITPTVYANIPRTIIALYDSKHEPSTHASFVHLYGETPLNHLGFRLEYHDVTNPLPDINQRQDVVGVLSWYQDGTVVPNPHEYIQWAVSAIDAGKKFVILENPGFYVNDDNGASLRDANQLWAKLGLRDLGTWNLRTYSAHFTTADRNLVGFEREYTGILPNYRQMEAIEKDPVTVHASLGPHVMIATSPNGATIAHEYALYYIYNQEADHKQWYVNPFSFFRLAFDPNNIPKADTTTLAGRRIYYSHIDGDGWNNVTMLEEYRSKGVLCPEVIYNKILQPNPDLPCTVAPIGADITLSWVGTPKGRALTTRLLSLPNIEVGCHTFTHPFDWQFFEHYNPDEEKPYFSRYAQGGWEKPTVTSALSQWWDKLTQPQEPFTYPIKNLQEGYEVPRAFALKPFNLELEVRGALDAVNELTPSKAKRAMLYQWSGNCLPFESILKAVREANIVNINGGITRFDDEFPSYAWVSPLGRRVGDEQQIYASNSNENTYTKMWMGKYYGFNQLPQTFKNTETPIRLRPMNLYYHMYSGERQASLNALKENIAFVHTQEIAPVNASHFSQMISGFYATEFEPVSAKRWKILNRGELQTIRFDKATLQSVDFAQSEGVVGQRHFQGSLYVYLDAKVDNPIIALKDEERYWEEPQGDVPYLIDSRWLVYDLVRHEDGSVDFTSQGFGASEMRWYMPGQGVVAVNLEPSWTAVKHSLGKK